MTHTTPRLATFVWLFLICATLLSAWLAEHHGFAGDWTAAVVMLVAAVKGRAVILHFMEVKTLPLAWRIAYEAWMWLVCILIVAFWAFPGLTG